MSVDPTLFDRFATEYDRFVSLQPGQNTAWLEGLGLRGERAIDVGCGSGHAVEFLADHFDSVLGVDLSEPMIGIAQDKRSRPNVEYRVADVFDLAEDGFDLVYSHTMMHHLPDYRAGLRQLKDLVRPGGTVAVVDNVCDLYPTPPRRAYTWGARLGFPKEIRRLGLRDAWFELRFWHSKPWLEHLLSDVYLSRAQFRETYDSIFPGARYDDLGFALAMHWTAPTRAGQLRSAD
ncbi:ubiquinone/menaquinone biosynthesis C-methylase UbiE [Kribbella sp. VKM Ac-2527]|uniref:Ubiquinone/menaquinone biosynthesis C-methylase UbiE n=1 Tax=Kribbella caucasensis TaxID=2512215 RepID=A0A4R6KQJ3_9ACTN|nr:class I SAM-dependent methyltransferase [Kribbella sp. VKM Ac-2527]TDO54976.1 ubiquinone/menaquinone biosynthesis C-methylase UbiE [Kribbella sp. VKM Ac-2527]